ncbi:MAG: ComEA family DNA-binding protein [Desulfuromonadaceae bacterium]
MDRLVRYIVFAIALVGALKEGGWYWLLFVIAMVWIWGNKLMEEEKAKATAKGLPTTKPTDAPSPTETSPIKSDWGARLTEICVQYSAADYYVGGGIPTAKLYAALKAYPLPNGGFPVALIDTTIFVSPDCGMLIGRGGVSWHNWQVPTKISALEWTDLSKLAISIDGSKIKIGNDGVFETSGSQLGTDVIKAMLERLQAMWDRNDQIEDVTSDEVPDRNILPTPSLDDGETAFPTDLESLPPEPPTQPVLDNLDINTADFDSLLAIPGIGAAEAKLLIQHRDSYGPLTSIDEMATVLSLKPHIVERLRHHVTFSMVKPQPPEPPKSPPPIPPASEPTPAPPKPTGPVRAPIDF